MPLNEPRAAGIVEYAFSDGRRVRLLEDGEPLNLTAAGGNPIQVMDAGYSLQTLSVVELDAEDVDPAGRSA
jgi:S-adenosylhomocysteine hydrolase